MLVICPLLPNLCRFSLLQDGTTLTAPLSFAVVQQNCSTTFGLIRIFASCQGAPWTPLRWKRLFDRLL